MWEVRYLPGVEEWLDELTPVQFKLVAKEITLLRKLGNILRLPHSKALGKGLFELRERDFGFRVYYTFEKNRCIILLCAGNKKSQSLDIKLARKLQEEMKK